MKSSLPLWNTSISCYKEIGIYKDKQKERRQIGAQKCAPEERGSVCVRRLDLGNPICHIKISLTNRLIVSTLSVIHFTVNIDDNAKSFYTFYLNFARVKLYNI